MTFLGVISTKYSMRNPYAESEDYMDVTVTRDWTYGSPNFMENIFNDLLDAGLNPEPKMGDDYPFRTKLTYQLIEMDSENKYVDFATVSFSFFLGAEDWSNYDHYFYVNEDDSVGALQWFHTEPAVNSKVKALLISYESYEQNPYPVP